LVVLHRGGNKKAGYRFLDERILTLTAETPFGFIWQRHEPQGPLPDESGVPADELSPVRGGGRRALSWLHSLKQPPKFGGCLNYDR